MKNLKLYDIKFAPMWPVPCGLVVLAENEFEAKKIAKETIKHTDEIWSINEIELDSPKVVFYESGEY